MNARITHHLAQARTDDLLRDAQRARLIRTARAHRNSTRHDGHKRQATSHGTSSRDTQLLVTRQTFKRIFDLRRAAATKGD